MRMFPDPPPAEAEVYGRLKFLREVGKRTSAAEPALCAAPAANRHGLGLGLDSPGQDRGAEGF